MPMFIARSRLWPREQIAKAFQIVGEKEMPAVKQGTKVFHVVHTLSGDSFSFAYTTRPAALKLANKFNRIKTSGELTQLMMGNFHDEPYFVSDRTAEEIES